MGINESFNNLLFGTYDLNVDTSGRFILPIDYRRNFKNGCFLMKGVGCIWLMPSEYFAKVLEQLRTNSANPLLDIFNKDRVAIVRHIMSGLTECNPQTDKNWRISISTELKNYSGIGSAVKLFGIGDYIEIWEPKSWGSVNEVLKNDAIQMIGENLFNPLSGINSVEVENK